MFRVFGLPKAGPWVLRIQAGEFLHQLTAAVVLGRGHHNLRFDILIAPGNPPAPKSQACPATRPRRNLDAETGAVERWNFHGGAEDCFRYGEGYLQNNVLTFAAEKRVGLNVQA